ncbi:ABC transporter ATP-binding protein [Rossellomorea aquimaris]|uniref:ABC transporter ATP-binding protein n=1 Tax=Rossellomorea aquimaris TaxID=189382 RepID=UPI0007D075B6|nr:ABC transporter ATP-binding protein [Rossellomorea aquimaris]
MSAFIHISQISKTFNKSTILKELTLSVKKGEILSLVGTSGSGKSTFLRIVAGLESPSSGSITIDGKDVTSLKAHNRPIGMVFQQPLLFPHMNVLENVMYGLKMKQKNKGNVQQAKEYIEKVGLGNVKYHYPAELSGGQQQRVSLIRTLILKPKLLLLDEPFSNLDLQLRKELREWVLKMFKEEETTVIFVTHDRDEAYEMGDRVAVLHDGSFSQIGTPEEVYYHPNNSFVASFLSDGLILHPNQFVHSKHIKVNMKANTNPSFLKWKGKLVKKLFMAGEDVYQVNVDELDQKMNVPLKIEPSSKEIWLYADRESIQTFREW